MKAAIINFIRRHIRRHPAAADIRARRELARKARMASDARHRAKCLEKFGVQRKREGVGG